MTMHIHVRLLHAPGVLPLKSQGYQIDVFAEAKQILQIFEAMDICCECTLRHPTASIGNHICLHEVTIPPSANRSVVWTAVCNVLFQQTYQSFPQIYNRELHNQSPVCVMSWTSSGGESASCASSSQKHPWQPSPFKWKLGKFDLQSALASAIPFRKLYNSDSHMGK